MRWAVYLMKAAKLTTIVKYFAFCLGWNIVYVTACTCTNLTSNNCDVQLPLTMSKINLVKWDESKDGLVNEGNMRAKLNKLGFNCIKYSFPPGTVFPDHTHSESKMDSIIAGRFELGMYGQKVEMEPGDMVEVPRNVIHNARVLGKETVVFFDGSK